MSPANNRPPYPAPDPRPGGSRPSRPGETHGRGSGPGRYRGRRRRRGWSRRAVGGLLAVLVCGVAVLLAHNRNDGVPTDLRTTPASVAFPATAAISGASPAEASTTTADGSAAPTGPDPGPSSGSGRFVTAQASGDAVGSGHIRRYEVQVEEGLDLSADDAAHEIAGILADPRGWTADGHDGFQLVSHGSHDFEIKIATPATVDRICGAAGLDTHGEVNCDVGDQVVVNLKRWNTGSPEFPGPVTEYRALIINHEVGHRIGHGHESCPGPGRPAPVMMQQIYGLHGCVANAWPYDEDGNYLGGPPVS